MARDSKAEQVYTALREEILTGELRPGTSLSVLKMADRFGASRTPVRDAFLRLESDGLVSLIDRQGARVSPISIRGVRDLFEIRTMLESDATRRVAAAAEQDEKIGELFAGLRAEFEAIAGQDDTPARRDRFYELTEAYDQAVIATTRNQHLSRIIAELRPHSARLRIIAHSPRRLEESLSEHLAMCDAILAHDPGAAASACIEHLAKTQRTVLDAILDPDSSGATADIVSP
ncbi:GntR family transcriptional regulator [Mycolicibacterium litorale]|nr:GntR family transcriptional regulator [Mycolicibacterium litorale]